MSLGKLDMPAFVLRNGERHKISSVVTTGCRPLVLKGTEHGPTDWITSTWLNKGFVSKFLLIKLKLKVVVITTPLHDREGWN